MSGIGRRDFLRGSAAAGFTGMLGAAQGQDAAKSNGRWLLDARFKETTLADTRVRLRTYNGQVPGPLMRIHPGETLRIRVQNSLPKTDSHGWDGDPDVPHMLDTTNLHLHGLDIMPHLFEPVGTSNPLAPMIAIRPGEHKDYEFLIPKDQPPGLYWYHPHHHGSTAVQAASGMAGGIIVHGEIDEVPEIRAARDIPLVIQDAGLFPSEEDPNLWTYEPKQNAIWQTFEGYVTIKGVKTNLQGGFTTGDYKLRYYLLNGHAFYKETHNYTQNKQTDPVPTQLPVTRIRMAPGEVVRFRMLNGCSDNLMPIVVEDHPLYLLAMDGNNYEAPVLKPVQPINGSTPQVLVAPANRAEFLIQGNSRPGIYRIVQLAQSQQFLFSAQKVLAEIEIAGPVRNMGIPRRLPRPSRDYPLIKPGEIKRVRQFLFNSQFPGKLNPIVGIDFMINHALYDEFAVPTTVHLNEAEEWHIIVPGSQHGGTEGHPFHIHVNDFEVISIGGIAQPPGMIQDTIWVPMNTEVVIRTKFKQWTGKSVFHCHILPHEDTGMMQNFLIFPPSEGRMR